MYRAPPYAASRPLSGERMVDAVYRNRLDLVVDLVAAGASPDWASKNSRRNYLCIALEKNYRDMAEMLLWLGASMETAFKDILLLVQDRPEDAWKLDFIFGAINERNLPKPIHVDPRYSTPVVQRLLTIGVDIDQADENGIPALAYHILYGNPDRALEFLAAGADPFRTFRSDQLWWNGLDEDRTLVGLNQILLACGRPNNTAVVRELLNRGVSFRGQVLDPLFLAVKHESCATVALLLEAGADPNLNSTKLISVALAGKQSLVLIEILLASGCTVTPTLLQKLSPGDALRSPGILGMLLTYCEEQGPTSVRSFASNFCRRENLPEPHDTEERLTNIHRELRRLSPQRCEKLA